MVFKIDFRDGTVLEWSKRGDGAVYETVTDYAPSLFVAASPAADLTALETELQGNPKVTRLRREEWFHNLSARQQAPVVRVDLDRIEAVRPLAVEIRQLYERGSYRPGAFKLYNVDFSPQFRYCIETGTPPVPQADLSVVELGLGEKQLADRELAGLEFAGDPVAGDEPAILRTVADRIADADPDVLLLNSADLIPVLYSKANQYEITDFDLGRLPGWSQLAGESTFESYGRVGHSPARYNVPGRVILDRANSFLYHQSDLGGLLYLVEQSWKPLQETGWASIGNVLTAIQIRKALERDVLVPWNKWEPEQFKDVRALHAADRGGFTFEPNVGLHEDVYEIDFSSLYPNIICQYNISPDTILCPCHEDRSDIPEIGYQVCDRPGFLPAVLQPLLDDRAAVKRQLADPAAETPDRVLEAESSAIKWILVSCFGYQGYRNSKFGRIECHEAINAVARDILLTAKERLEANNWEIVHGIVDSLWVRKRAAPAAPLEQLIEEITAEVGITLEFESQYDWVCFVPKRRSQSGALTKYFGKVAGADEYKYRGIEVRQRSTPAYIKAAQEALIRALDRYRDPEPVCDVLAARIAELRSGEVAPEELVIRQRISKRPAEYAQRTRAVAALRRYEDKGVARQPGQDVRYVVVNDSSRSMGRVRLHFEAIDRYDVAFYVEQLVRAGESVLSPVGWDRERIRRYLQDGREVGLAAFG